MTGLLIKRRLRILLVATLIAGISMIKGVIGQSLELGCPIKVCYATFSISPLHLHMPPS